jgi:O-antigen/teichoic acid export membrane protein
MGWVLVSISAFSVCAHYLVYRRVCRELGLGLRSIRLRELKLVLSFGGLVLAASLANMVALEGPKQVVGKVVSLDALGVFGLALLLNSYYRQLTFNVTRVLAPRFSFLSGRDGSDRIRGLFLQWSRYVAILAAAIALLFWVSGPSFLLLWTGRPQVAEAIPALVILATGNLVLLSNRVTSDLLLGVGRQASLTFFEVVEAVGIGGLVVVLTSRFGITGTALGMAVPFVIVRGIFQAKYVCRFLGLSLWRYYRRCLLWPWLVAGSLAGLAYLLGLASRQSSWLSMTASSAFVAGAYGALIYGLALDSAERLRFREWAGGWTKAVLRPLLRPVTFAEMGCSRHAGPPGTTKPPRVNQT